ncbi:MAG: hypothetical protein AAGF31_10255, partial [Planctomycetota bacterium]
MTTAIAPRRRLFPSLWREPRHGMLEEMENLVGRLWDDGEQGWFVGHNVPSADVTETDAAVEAKLDLPGVKPEEIDI